MRLKHLVLMFVVYSLANISFAAEPAPDAFAACKALGRGVNLGNALEAPKEGDWGVKLEASFFPQIKKAGFQHVRVPTKWSAHAAAEAPYTIEAAFFARIDWVLDEAEKAGLAVVLNVHHYDEMDKDPDHDLDRLIGLWKQIAARYRNRPASLYFELMNEPHDKLNDEGKWNACIEPLLKAVREMNPTRPVIVGGAWWNGIWAVLKLKLPDDPNLIVTVHCYNPHEFTHQGAPWAKDSEKWLGRKWSGTPEELKKMCDELDIAVAYGKEHKRPIYLGEFGAFEKADMASRAAWTKTLAREAEARGWSWAYWEFCAGFGVYDREKKEWRGELKEALMGP